MQHQITIRSITIREQRRSNRSYIGSLNAEKLLFDTSWALAQANVPETWTQFDTKGGGESVAIPDLLIASDHPGLEILDENSSRNVTIARFNESGDIVAHTLDPYLEYPITWGGHAPGVSGVAVGGNSSGVHIGVAPEADLIYAQLEGVFSPNSSTFADIMGWMVDNNATAVSLSVGISDEESLTPAMAAIDNATDNGTDRACCVGQQWSECHRCSNQFL
ncbi:MAG: S8 family serine peptidase [Natrialbaceae archaeon]|nr:S8 family serine peptidase [Natrialbaceae archaeon]